MLVSYSNSCLCLAATKVRSVLLRSDQNQDVLHVTVKCLSLFICARIACEVFLKLQVDYSSYFIRMNHII